VDGVRVATSSRRKIRAREWDRLCRIPIVDDRFVSIGVPDEPMSFIAHLLEAIGRLRVEAVQVSFVDLHRENWTG
jgi:hypothetical protein